MGITISGGGSGGGGITVETDPTALKLTGGTLSGTLFLPTARNLLNEDLNIQSYNDTGAGTTYTHSFKPYDGTFQLATNGGGLRFPDSTVQTTAGLPLTGGSITGKLTTTTPTTTTPASINIGAMTTGNAPLNPASGDIWISQFNFGFRTASGTTKYTANLSDTNSFSAPQIIDTTNSAAALRVTQKGTGHAILVEDSVNPDTSSFFVTSDGLVCLGHNPASPPSGNFLNINGSIGWSGQATQTHTNPFSSYNNEIAITINGVVRYIPLR